MKFKSILAAIIAAGALAAPLLTSSAASASAAPANHDGVYSAIVFIKALDGNCLTWPHSDGRNGKDLAPITETSCKTAAPFSLYNLRGGSELREFYNPRLSIGFFGNKIALVPTSSGPHYTYFHYTSTYTFFGVTYLRFKFAYNTYRGQYWKFNGLGRQLTLTGSQNYQNFFAFSGCSQCQPEITIG